MTPNKLERVIEKMIRIIGKKAESTYKVAAPKAESFLDRLEAYLDSTSIKDRRD